MKNRLRYWFLLAIKAVTLVFYRHQVRWLTPQPEPPWRDLRVIAILNHTSLYEWLFAGAAPNHLLERVARLALVPAADITIRRPVVGTFIKLLAPELVSITREPDHTWDAVLERVDDNRMVVILPEGRMKRANGLDKHGQPMTVRGGIADILRAVPAGRMLLAYSGGLHHVQVPGQRVPRLFKTVKVAFEMVDIAGYRDSLAEAAATLGFKRAVVQDLQRRRDLHCAALESR